MTLVLSVVRCPDASTPPARRLTGGSCVIGRGDECDWQLPDPDRHLSKRHCEVTFRSGQWRLTDLSTNGTFLNRGNEPIGRGNAMPVSNGDRITLGDYDLEARLEQGAASNASPFNADPFAADPFAADPFASNAFAPDPMAPPVAPPAPFAADPYSRGQGAPRPGNASPGDPFADLAPPSQGGEPSMIPDDFDPFAEPGDREADWSQPTRADHAPAVSDAFTPPKVTPSAIPDDWDDLDLAPATAPNPEPAPQPPPAPRRQPAREAPVPAAPVAAAPVSAPRVQPPPPPTAPAAAPPASPSAEPQLVPDSALLSAFLAGAGIGGTAVPTEAAMRGLGTAFRAFVEGLREVLITRATIKSEFRIEQTIIASRGNNPLKFSPTSEDALAAMLGPMLGQARTGFMAPEVAVRDALDDIKRHEIATMAAMQAAIRALLARLDPVALREEADKAGGLSVLPAQKRARAFEIFEQRLAEITNSLDDTADGAFARAFARAYEAESGRR